MKGGVGKCWGRCEKVCWGEGEVKGDVGKGVGGVRTCWGRCGKVCWGVGKCWEGVRKCVGMWERWEEMRESVGEGVKKCFGVWGKVRGGVGMCVGMSGGVGIWKVLGKVWKSVVGCGKDVEVWRSVGRGVRKCVWVGVKSA